MLRRLISALTLLLTLLVASPLQAQQAGPREQRPLSRPPAATAINWQLHQVQLGETLALLAQRSGTTPEVLAQANHLLNPANLPVGTKISVPQPRRPLHLVAAPASATPLEVAATYNVPLWEILRLNPRPVMKGESYVLPGRGPATALPAPLEAISLSPQPVIRGQTAALMLKTSVPASCTITYLGHTEPCYTQDQRHLYAFIGLSALMDAGSYRLLIRLQANGAETDFTLPLEVAAGHYGFQTIDVPPSLDKLLDVDLLQRELDYLKFWRAVRLDTRYWDFPLHAPLPPSASVSAGYGDRRLYGGVVPGYHSGVDYRAVCGTPVRAPADGVVMLTHTLEVRGNVILIDHGWGLVTGYWHLSRIDVHEGQHVRRGEQIGLVGSTGLSTGAHLHWEMWVNGVSVDARQWLDPNGFAGLTLPPVAEAAQTDTLIAVR